MSVTDETVSFSFEINLEEAYTALRRFETLLYRSLGLVRRVSGNEDLNKMIALFQRGIAVANAFRLSLIALETAAGPWGWAIAGVSAATSLFAASDFATEVMSR